MYLVIPNTFFVNICYTEKDIFDIKDMVVTREENYNKILINETRKEIIIGIALPTDKEEIWIKDKDYMEKYALQQGPLVKVKVADTTIEKQTLQVDELIKEGIEVLILAPVDSFAAVKMVEKANKAGIKVIAYDRLIKNSDIDLYISFEAGRVGELQGKFLIENVPKGNYIILSGDPDDNNSMLLKEGAMKYISPLVNKGDIKIVLDQAVDNWDSQNAYNIVKNYLMTNNKVDAILAPNDATAGAVIKALEENGLAGKVIVVGQDADLEAARRIIKGTQAMTVFKDSKELSKLAIDSAIKFVKGEVIDINGVVNNGKVNVPVFSLPPILVNKNNLQKILIDSGYLNKNDVYNLSIQ